MNRYNRKLVEQITNNAYVKKHINNTGKHTTPAARRGLIEGSDACLTNHNVKGH